MSWLVVEDRGDDGRPRRRCSARRGRGDAGPRRRTRGRARREDRLPQPRRHDRRGRDVPARRPGGAPAGRGPTRGRSVLLGDDGPLRAAVEALGVRVRRPADARAASPASATPARPGLRRGRSPWRRAGPRRRSAALAYRDRLAARLRAERPDLVQTNGMKTHLLGAWASPRGVPVVWHLHDYLGLAAGDGAAAPRARPGRASRRSPSRESVADDARATLRGRVPVRAIYNARRPRPVPPRPRRRPVARPRGRAARGARGDGPRRPGGHLRQLEGARRLPRRRRAAPGRPARRGSTSSAGRSTGRPARRSRSTS